MKMSPAPPMFLHFQESHEQTLAAILRGEDVLPVMATDARHALDRCLMLIIDELKTVGVTERRRELKALYEGVSIAYEFITRDDSVPAVRDFN